MQEAGKNKEGFIGEKERKGGERWKKEIWREQAREIRRRRERRERNIEKKKAIYNSTPGENLAQEADTKSLPILSQLWICVCEFH